MRPVRFADGRSNFRGLSGRSRAGSKVRSPHRRRLAFEPLESRRLLHGGHHVELPPTPAWSEAIEQQFAAGLAGSEGGSGGADTANIVWVNRDTFSGGNDNKFDEVFGTMTATAQSVVDA